MSIHPCPEIFTAPPAFPFPLVCKCAALLASQTDAAVILQCMYRQWHARHIRRWRRVERTIAAARLLQRNYRARLSRLWLEACKLALRIRHVTIIQALWRGHEGRRAAAAERALQAAEELVMLSSAPSLAAVVSAASVSDSVGTDASDQTLLFALQHMCGVSTCDYGSAWGILKAALERWPRAPSVLYAAAICLQLLWQHVGRYHVRHPWLFEDAITLALAAQSLDPDGTGFQQGFRIMHAAWRLQPRHWRARLHLALAHWTVFGSVRHCAGAAAAAAVAARSSGAAARRALKKAAWHLSGALQLSRSQDATAFIRECEACQAALLNPPAPGANARRCMVSCDTAAAAVAGTRVLLSVPAAITEAAGGAKLLVAVAGRCDAPRWADAECTDVPPALDPSAFLLLHEDDMAALAATAAARAINASAGDRCPTLPNRFAQVVGALIPSLTLALRPGAAATAAAPDAIADAAAAAQQLALMSALVRALRERAADATARRRAAAMLQRAAGVHVRAARGRRERAAQRAREADERAAAQRRAAAAEQRRRRHRCAAVIQAAMRARRWRRDYLQRRRACVCIQCAWRRALAAREVRLRRAGARRGPRAVTVLSRGCEVDGRPVLLTARRCGRTYELRAADPERCCVHVGVFTQAEVTRVLESKDACAGMTGRGRAAVWNHERVVEMLIAGLAIRTVPKALTRNLVEAAPETALVLRGSMPQCCSITETISAVNEPSEQCEAAQHGMARECFGGSRVLADTAEAVAPAYAAYERRRAQRSAIAQRTRQQRHDASNTSA
ncbi:hypothetical protein JKP88DRAFT_283750 [Tribonema minus]|uniref:Uncharacterized protein n=1 Tax=Tribonema minus TaxID=303371 RepID=A0A835YKE9_9STRA|nr:hypothetical protein JKP88DRAFT_283750 [Tribonema minus]